MFFIVIWSLWGYRNKILFEKKSVNYEEFIQELKRWSSWCVEKGYVKVLHLDTVFSSKLIGNSSMERYVPLKKMYCAQSYKC